MEKEASGGLAGGPAPGPLPHVRELMASLRSALIGLGGVTERQIVDYDTPGESPAFYVGARQLCHVHEGKDRLEVTVSLSRELTFDVLHADDVPEAIRGVVERTREYGATRWVSVPVAGAAELEGLLALARRKHRFLAAAEGSGLAVPRDQTTLEKFE